MQQATTKGRTSSSATPASSTPACPPSGTATWTQVCLPGQLPATPRTKPQCQARASPPRPTGKTGAEPGTGQPPNRKQHQLGTAAGTEQVTGRNHPRSAAPNTDWRDQVLRQARQPGQPGPSWPHSPALHHTSEPGRPDAG